MVWCTNVLFPDQQIVNELLLHEAGLGALPGGGLAGPSTTSSSKSPTPGRGGGGGGGGRRGGDVQGESSSSELEEEEEGRGWAQTIPENSGNESSDEEFTMKVSNAKCGHRVVVGKLT